MAKTKAPDPVKLLVRLGARPEIKPFYLAGGTALHLQLHHRRSMDLDFFTEKKFDPLRMVNALKEDFALTVSRMEAGSLLLILDGLPVSFFEYPYPLLKREAFRGIPMASALDIALMKLVAIVQRGARRDFTDLYGVLHSTPATLETLLQSAKKKFKGISLNEGTLLKALVYFEDAEKSAPLIASKVPWKEVKRYFRQTVKEFSGRWI